MKRHTLLALLRVLLAVGVVFALPFSHAQWGHDYPGDGQDAFGFIIIFTVIGFAAAAVYLGLGSLFQFLLRKRQPRFTVFTDLGLFLVFSGLLIYGGVTAKYEDSQPNKGASANRRSVATGEWPCGSCSFLTGHQALTAAVAELLR